jgi:hypothetical protein
VYVIEKATDNAVGREILATVATLLLLRRRQLGSLVTRLVRRNQYKLDPPPSVKRTSASRKVLRFSFDLSVSFFIGIGVFMYNTDYPLLAAALVSTPLLPGRSVIAEEFCEDVCREYHKQKHSTQVDSSLLVVYGTFVRNCELRKAYEGKLRRELGLQLSTPVSIPPPGVPMDYTLKEDAFQTKDKEEAPENKIDEEWADSLVTDREMQEDKNNSKK